MNFQVGAVVGPFRIDGELGRGAMGAVFRATDLRSGQAVALKMILHAEQTISVQRFIREAQVVARLRHPRIVTVLDAGEFGGVPCIVYELVEGGRTLQDAFEELLMIERVELVLEVAAALAYVHSEGLVHRDVKPGNVLLDAGGHARLTDFGLVAGEDLERLTRTGGLVGTPAYMAPEQIACEREAIGPHSDVWALGVLLYEALTGNLPFRGETALELMVRARQGAPPPPSSISEEAIPRGGEVVCLRALAKAPGDRYPDAGAFHEALESVLDGTFRAPLKMPWAAIGVGGVILVGALGLGAAVLPSPAATPAPTSPLEVASASVTPSEPVRTTREWTTLARKLIKAGKEREALEALERALAQDPQDLIALFNRGQAHHGLKDYAQAIRDFEAVLAQDPEHPQAYFYRASAEWDLNQKWEQPPDLQREVEGVDGFFYRAITRSRAQALAGAQADYTEVIKLRPDFNSAYNNRGNIRADLGNLHGALEDLTIAAKRGRGIDALLNRASVLAKLYRPLEALADIETALKRRPKNVRALCAKSGAKRDLKDYEAAERLLKRALLLDPDSTRIQTELALLRTAQERFDESVAIYEELLKKEPTSSVFLNNLAALHMDHGRPKLAEPLLRQLLKVHPHDGTALSNLAALLMRRGDLREAQDLARRATEAAPEELRLGLTAAAILLRLKKPDEALKEVQRILNRDPNMARAYYVRAKARIDKSQFDLALEALTRSLELNPDSNESLQERGTLYLNTKRYKEALVDLDLLVQRRPTDKSHTYRGHARLQLDDKTGAMEDYEEAIRLNPKSKDALNNRSALLTQAGKHKEALPSVNTLVEIAPHIAGYWYSRADILFKLGDFRGAQRDCAKFRELAPTDPDGPLLEGRAWQGLNQHQRAIECFEFLLAKNPKQIAGLAYLADSLTSLEKWAEVAETYDRLLGFLKPGAPVVAKIRQARDQAAAKARASQGKKD